MFSLHVVQERKLGHKKISGVEKLYETGSHPPQLSPMSTDCVITNCFILKIMIGSFVVFVCFLLCFFDI